MEASQPRASVVIPTIGRAEQLRGCLAALAAADPPPTEVLVVDQSRRGVARSVAERTDEPVRVVDDDGIGPARARNLGARLARCELLLFVDDDCLAKADWVGVAWRLHQQRPTALFTGRVLAGRGRLAEVPSVREDPTPTDHTGTKVWGGLYSNNMTAPREAFLAFGGFDERFDSAAGEDNDLCYRWLQAGRRLLYDPSLVVEHMDWRTASELEAVWRGYGRGQGMFYAKHLRKGDLRMLSFLLGDVRAVLRARLARQPTRTPSLPALSTELRSLVGNWRRFR